MYINVGTIILTLIIIAIVAFFGIRIIRSFALQIAQENHDAVMALDQKEQHIRLKREQAADAAAASAFAKLQPILTTEKSNNSNNSKGGGEKITTTTMMAGDV
jgi:hypothetical protein